MDLTQAFADPPNREALTFLAACSASIYTQTTDSLTRPVGGTSFVWAIRSPVGSKSPSPQVGHFTLAGNRVVIIEGTTGGASQLAVQMIGAWRAAQLSDGSIVNSYDSDNAVLAYNALPSDLPVILTGHSLGGAIAIVLGAIWQKNLPGKLVGVATFGAPNNCNATYAANFGGIPITNIENDTDLVPYVPPNGFGGVDWQKPGRRYLLASNGVLTPAPVGSYVNTDILGLVSLDAHASWEYPRRLAYALPKTVASAAVATLSKVVGEVQVNIDP